MPDEKELDAYQPDYKPHEHIHRTLKKHVPKGVHKAKKLVGFKYPKLLLLCISIIAAYFLFHQTGSSLISKLNPNSPISMFFAGGLFTFGFSAAFSIGFFILSNPQNILLASVIAGVGATAADFMVFKTIKFSFMEEFKQLEKKRVIKKIERIVESNKHVLIRHYLLYIFAGFMIATPLPDEIGVSMLAGLTTIKPLKLVTICLILHTLTIFMILYISSVV